MPRITPNSREIVSPFHRQGNFLPSAAIRWPDFANQPSVGRPFAQIPAIEKHPFCRFHLAVDFPGQRAKTSVVGQFDEGSLLMLWSAPSTGISMCQIPATDFEPPMPAHGTKRKCPIAGVRDGCWLENRHRRAALTQLSFMSTRPTAPPPCAVSRAATAGPGRRTSGAGSRRSCRRPSPRCSGCARSARSAPPCR